MSSSAIIIIALLALFGVGTIAMAFASRGRPPRMAVLSRQRKPPALSNSIAPQPAPPSREPAPAREAPKPAPTPIRPAQEPASAVEPARKMYAPGDPQGALQDALLDFHRGADQHGRALAAAAWAGNTARADELARSLIEEAKSAIASLPEGDTPQRRDLARTLRNAAAVIAERDLGAACLALAEAREIEPLIPINANQLGALLLAAGAIDSADTSFTGAYLASVVPPGQDRIQEGIALTGLGNVALERKQLDQAEEQFNKARVLFEELGLPEGQIRPLFGLGTCREERGDRRGARDLFQRALEIAQRLAIEGDAAALLDNLGNMHQKLGDLAAAEACYRQALDLDTRLGRELGRAATLGNFALVLQARGDLDAAQKHFEAALEIDHRLGAKKQEATDLHNLANLAQTRGESEKSARLYRQAIEINRELGLKDRQAAQLVGLGIVAREQGNPQEAEQLFQQAMGLSKEAGDKEGEVIALHHLADAAAKKDPATALVMFQRALALNEELGRRDGQARNLSKMGQLCRESGLLDDAQNYHRRALAIYEEVGIKEGRAAELFNLGLVALMREDRPECGRLWLQSRALYQEMGIAHEVADIDARLAHFGLAEEAGQRQPMSRARAAISILAAMTFADGEMQDEEGEWLVRTCNHHRWFQQTSNAEFSTTMNEAIGQLGSQPWRDLVSQWAQSIAAADREEMFGLAVHLGMADDEPLGLEGPLLNHLQQCLGISGERARQIFQEKANDV